MHAQLRGKSGAKPIPPRNVSNAAGVQVVPGRGDLRDAMRQATLLGQLQRAAAAHEAGDLPHERQHLAADLAARQGPSKGSRKGGNGSKRPDSPPFSRDLQAFSVLGADPGPPQGGSQAEARPLFLLVNICRMKLEDVLRNPWVRPSRHRNARFEAISTPFWPYSQPDMARNGHPKGSERRSERQADGVQQRHGHAHRGASAAESEAVLEDVAVLQPLRGLGGASAGPPGAAGCAQGR